MRIEKVYAATEVNIALEKTYSSSESQLEPSYAFDGYKDYSAYNEGAFWASENLDNNKPENPPWLQVDLGSPHNINRFVVIGSGQLLNDNTAKSITLKGSLDGINFETIRISKDVALDPTTGLVTHEGMFSTSVNYRYVRVEVTEVSWDNGDTSYAGILEFELYGQPATGDTAAPNIENGGTISVSSVTSSGCTLNWTKATDDITKQRDLEYQVYLSTNSNFNSVDEVEGGLPLSNGFTKDLNTWNITGLSPNTMYYFNVLVRDTAGNKSVYKSAQVKTPNLVNFPTLPFTQTFDLVRVGTESEKNQPLILDGLVYSTDAIDEALHVDTIDNSGNTIGSGNALNAIWYGTNTGTYFQFASEDQINNFKMTSIELDMWDHGSQNAEKYVVTGYDDGIAKTSVLVNFKTEKGRATNYTDESSNPNSELFWIRSEDNTGDFTGGKLTFKGSLWANIDTVRFTVADTAPNTILGAVCR